jgi:threonine dehydrogenase-like Zn-dependent dehydrogenase
MRQKQNEDLADEVFNPLEQNVGDLCRERTEGDGVDFVFDAAGSAPGLADRIDALKYRGVYVNVAAWKGPFTIPFYPFLMKEIRVLGSSNCSLLKKKS